jgi:hypothetical protein
MADDSDAYPNIFGSLSPQIMQAIQQHLAQGGSASLPQLLQIVRQQQTQAGQVPFGGVPTAGAPGAPPQQQPQGPPYTATLGIRG